MNSTLEAVASLLGFLSWVLAGVTIMNRTWKVGQDDGNVITSLTTYENLWMSCAADAIGVHDCQEFPSLLALSGYMQASRALMIASILFGALGILATLVGMKCSKVAGENYLFKGKMAGIGGLFFLLQGICTMIAVSWYAFNITQDFFNPLNPVNPKFEIGDGLFYGWASGAIAICAGSCLTCACSFKTNEKTMPYPYQPPTRGTVYSAAEASYPSVHSYSNYGRNAYV